MNNGDILKDDDKFPYGKYDGTRMIDVPASYLMWLYDNNRCSPSVLNYIERNMDAIKKELQ